MPVLLTSSSTDVSVTGNRTEMRHREARSADSADRIARRMIFEWSAVLLSVSAMSISHIFMHFQASQGCGSSPVERTDGSDGRIDDDSRPCTSCMCEGADHRCTIIERSSRPTRQLAYQPESMPAAMMIPDDACCLRRHGHMATCGFAVVLQEQSTHACPAYVVIKRCHRTEMRHREARSADSTDRIPRRMVFEWSAVLLSVSAKSISRIFMHFQAPRGCGSSPVGRTVIRTDGRRLPTMHIMHA